jgi:hypothetical protein
VTQPPRCEYPVAGDRLAGLGPGSTSTSGAGARSAPLCRLAASSGGLALLLSVVTAPRQDGGWCIEAGTGLRDLIRGEMGHSICAAPVRRKHPLPPGSSEFPAAPASLTHRRTTHDARRPRPSTLLCSLIEPRDEDDRDTAPLGLSPRVVRALDGRSDATHSRTKRSPGGPLTY